MNLRIFLVGIGLSSWIASSALGHGSVYPPVTGPGDFVAPPIPPTSGPGTGPGGPPPTGPAPGPGKSPPAAGPRLPGPSTAGPSAPSGPGARGPTTGAGLGGKKRRAGSAEDSWEAWWRYNRHAFLGSRRSMHAATESGNAFLTGAGRSIAEAAYQAPTPEQVATLVVPALRGALGSDETEVVDSALIALAKCVPPELAGELAETYVAALKSPFPSVRQAAVLGLGIMGHRGGAPVLWEVMNDTREGRQRIGGRVPSVERAFAALALGFSMGPRMVPQLLRLVERMKDEDVEVVAGAVLSLGMVPEAATATIPVLVRLLGDEQTDRRIRAQVPIALARLGESASAVVPMLFEIAVDDKAGDDLRRSAVIALGGLVAADETEVVNGIQALVRRETDAPLRAFAWIALGQIAASSEGEAESYDRIVRFLLAELVDPKHATDGSFCALALGVAARRPGPAEEARRAIATELLDRFERTKNPSDQGALAIGLGLAGAAGAGPAILTRFADVGETGLKGHLAVALGLLGHAAAKAELNDEIVASNESSLRADLGIALSLLGEESAQPRLLEQLEASRSFASTVAVARALSHVGDGAAVERLAAVIADEARSGFVRGFACVALGAIAERTEVPWNAALSVNSNYLIGLQAQTEVLDIF